jgi:hypothetical protein
MNLHCQLHNVAKDLDLSKSISIVLSNNRFFSKVIIAIVCTICPSLSNTPNFFIVSTTLLNKFDLFAMIFSSWNSAWRQVTCRISLRPPYFIPWKQSYQRTLPNYIFLQYQHHQILYHRPILVSTPCRHSASMSNHTWYVRFFIIILNLIFITRFKNHRREIISLFVKPYNSLMLRSVCCI